jgi:glutathione synthase/RimK-type ligase-like ATP-grasp enzyme
VSRIALATSRFALPGSRGSLEANLDLDAPLVLSELAALGVEARLEVWDDERVDWESYDLVVVRSTWGYARVYDEFLAWAHARARLVNPYDVIDDLHDQGFPVIDTSYCEVGEEPHFPEGDVVVKPAIGAGSIDAERFRASDHAGARQHVARLHASRRCALIQPYASAIDEQGERALIFIDADFSHAMTKRAMLNVAPEERDGEFRSRQMSLASAEPAAIDLARQLLTGRFADLTYARVDLVASPQGWQLMELELVEPALYLGYDEHAPARLARAIARRLG